MATLFQILNQFVTLFSKKNQIEKSLSFNKVCYVLKLGHGFEIHTVWMKDVINKLENVEVMNTKKIYPEVFSNIINKTHNLRTPENDKIHNFWINQFRCTHS
jgi:hypothetical protein